MKNIQKFSFLLLYLSIFFKTLICLAQLFPPLLTQTQPLTPSAMIKVKLLKKEKLAIKKHYTKDIEAYDWDWCAAESSFKKAISLNPGYALAHLGYADYLLMTGGISP